MILPSNGMRWPSVTCPGCCASFSNRAGADEAKVPVGSNRAPTTPKMKPPTKTISGRTTSDFIGIPRLRPGAGCTEGYGRCFRGRGFFACRRAGDVLPEHLQTWLRTFLSLFHFPGKEVKVPSACDFGPVRSWDNYSH